MCVFKFLSGTTGSMFYMMRRREDNSKTARVKVEPVWKDGDHQAELF